MLAVSGNLGAGKTTLTTNLSRSLGWDMEPSRPYDIHYVQDQIEQPSRWSLEAQLAFLSNKVLSINQAIKRSAQFILDRSPYEDFGVFGAYWAARGFMDARTWRTYKDIAGLLLEDLPPPIAVIHCRTPWKVCKARIEQRPRSYQRRYPADHLKTLEVLYDKWLSTFTLAPIIDIDTTRVDPRTEEGIEYVQKRLVALEAHRNAYQPVLPTFEEDGNSTQVPPPSIYVPSVKPSPKMVYIAAAFSSHEIQLPSEAPQPTQQSLPELTHDVFGIPTGRYRRTLNSISQAIQRAGYRPFLPHRDINRWGRRTMTSKQVAEECLDAVVKCDIFLGILGDSFGSHAEAAAAISLRKPTILIYIAGTQETFFGTGLRQSKYAVSVEAANLRHLRRIIEAPQFRETIERAANAAKWAC